VRSESINCRKEQTCRQRAFVVAPSGHIPYDVLDRLSHLGCDIAIPSVVNPAHDDAESVLDAMREDIDTLAHADCLIVLPGASESWAAIVASALGVPIVHYHDIATLPA